MCTRFFCCGSLFLNFSHFVIPDALCNNSLPHFVIKLPCCTLQYNICQKRLLNWSATLCKKIIICILLPILKIKISYISTSTRVTYSHHTWQTGKLSWGTTTNKVTWRHEVTWQAKKIIYLQFHEVYDCQTWQGGGLK